MTAPENSRFSINGPFFAKKRSFYRIKTPKGIEMWEVKYYNFFK